MAWIKVPAEHHPQFHAALPDDPRVETLQMFGGIAAKTNGHMFAALFARSAMVYLGEADRAEALALDGAEPFDPMGTGRVHGDKIMLPEDVFHDAGELRSWLRRAFEFAWTLPRTSKPTKGAAEKAKSAKSTAGRSAKPTAGRSAKPTAGKSAKPSTAKPAKPSASKPAKPAKRAARSR